MERAARAVRRSSVKLMSLGGGHTDLHVLLSEVKDMRQAAKAFMNAQNAVSQDLLKWAANEENRALQDVANQLAELNLLWTEVQREFGEHLKDYRHMFEMVLEGEKHVSQSRNHFAVCEQREIKIRKELKKAFKKSSSAEIQSLEGRLAQAERAKHLAQLEVTDRVRENEAVKLIRIKEGLTKLSQAYSDFARKCSVVFDAQQDIVQELPDVQDQDLEDLKYTGTGVTRHCVQQAKERVRNYRTRKDYCQIPQKYSEPPPPYSLTNDLVDFVSQPIPCPVFQSTSPRRRISTATTTITDNLESSSSTSSKQQQRCCDYDKDSNGSSTSSSQHLHHLHHHHLHQQPHLSQPQPQAPSQNPSGILSSTPTPQSYDPLYPPLPYKTSCSSHIAMPVPAPPPPPPPPSNTISSSVSNTSTSITEVKMAPSPPTHSTHPASNIYNYHPSYVALGTSSTTTPSFHMAPPPTFQPNQQQQQQQPPPPPQPPMEAAVPEVPADLRPVISKPLLYSDDDNTGDDEDAAASSADQDGSHSSNIINKEREGKGIIGGGGGFAHHHNSIQETVVVGLVDFDPTWDDSYEDDLSGAMGGAKI